MREAREDDSPLLSVVLPAYNEAGNIGAAYRELRSELERTGAEWEIIVADDGSTDGTWGEVVELHAQDSRVKGVRLTRNFGHQYALLAGLQHARGEATITMDADLQHPPSLIPVLCERWRQGYRIVNTIRHDAPGTSVFKRVSSALYYRVFSALSGVPIQRGASDCRLLDREVLDELLRLDEAGPFFRGLVAWTGYPTDSVSFHARERHKGKTKYNLRRMLHFALDGVTSFSVTPLRIGVVIGLLTSLLAFGELVYAVLMKLVFGHTVPGWASAVSVISFLFGVLFVLLGLIGEYIGRILIEVRRRPRYLVRERVGTPNAVVDRTRPPRRDSRTPVPPA